MCDGLGNPAFPGIRFVDLCDLRLERDALQKHVFPAIAEHCARAGYGFQAIDMRWGIGDQASLQSAHTVHLSRRTFPLPGGITTAQLHRAARASLWVASSSLGDRCEGVQIVAGHLAGDDRDLAVEWLVLDENAVPAVKRLRPRTGSPKWILCSGRPLNVACGLGAARSSAGGRPRGERAESGTGCRRQRRKSRPGALSIHESRGGRLRLCALNRAQTGTS